MRPTAQAQRDHDDVLLNTGTTWGIERADHFDAAIAGAFDPLQTNPRLGAARVDLLPGLRPYLTRRHALYDRIESEAVPLVRIPHERVVPARHLRPWGGPSERL